METHSCKRLVLDLKVPQTCAMPHASGLSHTPPVLFPSVPTMCASRPSVKAASFSTARQSGFRDEVELRRGGNLHSSVTLSRTDLYYLRRLPFCKSLSDDLLDISARKRGIRSSPNIIRNDFGSRESDEHSSSSAEIRVVLGDGGLSPLPPSPAKTVVILEFASQVATAASSASSASGKEEPSEPRASLPGSVAQSRRMQQRKSERATYLWAAVASSVGFSSLAGGAVVYRFMSQMQSGGEIPYAEILGTLALAVGAAVGMEFWARWAHKALWHASLWHMHESHHRPRDGPFELNDVFAIVNAAPAIALMAYGFLHAGIVPGLCFGAGLGITIFGMAYMFVHDGLVHRRFPVGPVAQVPYFQKVAAAHQLHHADKFEGVPYGLFLGPQELEEVGGLADLEEVLAARKRAALEKGTP
eukprot:TRINITY_DN11234_c0_g1_i1.p1 TRINITY_DN11234_c0_g1~~TRINITY_DN11234_c0_g1_i1.p1  ORF type:complete len:416 (-),score=51.52 TRINITY_DN11234_c0_g1_i1:986-2233(-)